MKNDATFSRLQLLTGKPALERLQHTSVLLLGVGGVGSWAAEGLVRNGVGHLTIVDSDLVCVTNVNRQLQATHSTVGKPKVDVLRDRLLDINPNARIEIINAVYSVHNSEQFDLNDYHYVIDAIDSLGSKVELIKRALAADSVLFSSMGAACKLDPSAIRVGSFWKIAGCPLAKFVRKRLRNQGVSGDFTAVWSAENLPPHAPETACGSERRTCPGGTDSAETPHSPYGKMKHINGSAVHITAIYGFHLASLVTNHVIRRLDSPT